MPASPIATDSRPTSSGSAAATTEPKTSSNSASTSGRTTSSEVLRSSRATSVKSWFIAAMPTATTSSVSERTWPRMAS